MRDGRAGGAGRWSERQGGVLWCVVSACWAPFTLPLSQDVRIGRHARPFPQISHFVFVPRYLRYQFCKSVLTVLSVIGDDLDGRSSLMATKAGRPSGCSIARKADCKFQRDLTLMNWAAESPMMYE
mgnify:CR=1 FL=1